MGEGTGGVGRTSPGESNSARLDREAREALDRGQAEKDADAALQSAGDTERLPGQDGPQPGDAPVGAVGGLGSEPDPSSGMIGDRPKLEVLTEIANDADRTYRQALGDQSVGPWSHARPDHKDACREKMRACLDNQTYDPGLGATDRIYAAIAFALG